MLVVDPGGEISVPAKHPDPRCEIRDSVERILIESDQEHSKYVFRRTLLAALAVAMLVGCRSVDPSQVRRSIRLANDASVFGNDMSFPDSGNQSSQSTAASQNAVALIESRIKDGQANIELLEAIQLGLSHSGVARVTDGDSVVASRSTFYDIETAKARESAALAAFDATFQSSIYGRDIKRPPNALFGPGLVQPLSRDEASFNFGLSKPMVSGGETSLAYSPDPGYFFVANPTGSGFNPIRSSNIQLSVNQPLLRGAGRRINLIPVQITQIGIDQSRWDFKKAAMESVRGIVIEYWELYASRAAIKAVDEVLPLYQEIVRLQEEALKAGLAVKADVAKAEAQLNDVQLEKLRLESDAASQELRLRNLIGLQPGLDWVLNPITEPASVLVSDSANRFLEQALYSQPDIVRQRLNVQIRRLEVAVAENQFLPEFDINGLYRLNGVGENLGDALDQMGTLDFRDLQVGANLSLPLGRRIAKAGTLAANRQLQEDSELLQQQIFSVYYDLVRSLQRLDYAYRQFEKADKRLVAAGEWVKGSRLRYQNPNPDDGGSNWLLGNLNDYLDAIRFQTDAAAGKAELLADYNIELVKIEESKGTLLDFFGVYLAGDPCRQVERLSKIRTTEYELHSNPDIEPRMTGPINEKNSIQSPPRSASNSNPKIDRSIEIQHQSHGVSGSGNSDPISSFSRNSLPDVHQSRNHSGTYPLHTNSGISDSITEGQLAAKSMARPIRQEVANKSSQPPARSKSNFFHMAEITDRDFELTTFQ